MRLTLVTGASGFIGRHLVEELGHRQMGVLGVSRTAGPGLKQISSYGVEMDWSALLKGVDSIVHLAARVHVMRETAVDSLAAFRKANVESTLHLARSAAASGTRRFIFISSIKVNGEHTEPGRLFSADDPHAPHDEYAISKSEAETALLQLGRDTGMEIVVIRPPLVYGPGVKGNFATLMKWVSHGLPSPFRVIDNKRSIVHVGNLCDLIITCLDHAAASGQVFLVSDGQDVSTDQLLAALGRGAGRQIWHLPLIPKWAVPHLARTATGNKMLGNLQVDISKACRLLGWRPRSGLQDDRLLAALFDRNAN